LREREEESVCVEERERTGRAKRGGGGEGGFGMIFYPTWYAEQKQRERDRERQRKRERYRKREEERSREKEKETGRRGRQTASDMDKERAFFSGTWHAGLCAGESARERGGESAHARVSERESVHVHA